MRKLFISVVIPTWRENQVLSRCLASLFAQGYPQKKYEIIVISKDDLANLPKGKRIKMVKSNQGLNHAEMRNLGVSKSQGEIIAFCDDDFVSDVIPGMRSQLEFSGAPGSWLTKNHRSRKPNLGRGIFFVADHFQNYRKQ